ncbi:hypothetical protein [Burkholderia multivorans]|uniref:hypothetical protein n=1 Tax=Burkholderia multivorans TaxID=87883 RepID=UPI0011B1D1A4|nr:hypothetical protein [Burkholderia multivorans]MCA8339477.1 hypothetical protein [Burkholderia multivorans]
MKSAFDCAHAFFLSACALCVSLVLAALTVQAWGWNASNVAAWVQALGSIGAIVGAFMVGSRQIESDRRQTLENEARERARKSDAIMAVVTHAMGQASSTAESFRRMPTPVLKAALDQPIYSLAEAADALLNVPLHEVGSSEAVTQFASLQVVLKQMSAAVREFKAMDLNAATLSHIGHIERLTASTAMAQFHADSFAEAVATEH